LPWLPVVGESELCDTGV